MPKPERNPESWRADINYNRVLDATGEPIAYIARRSGRFPDHTANVYFIASGPDMYKALCEIKQILSEAVSMPSGRLDMARLYKIAEEAITKADGELP